MDFEDRLYVLRLRLEGLEFRVQGPRSHVWG